MNTENNKIIAEFMEWYYMGMSTYLTPYSDAWSTNGEQIYSCPLNVMRFHSDWNWLMEVVEKIESLDSCGIDIFNGSVEVYKDGKTVIKITTFETKIEKVYNACLDFIKWYNEQKEV